MVGAGSFGTALAQSSAVQGHRVTLWGRDEAIIASINKNRRNPRYLSDLNLHPGIHATLDVADLEQADLWLLCVPSHAMRETARLLASCYHAGITVAHAAKGLEVETLTRLSQVVAQELPDLPVDRLAVLSGPSHAEEMSKELPTTLVVASHSKSCAESIQDVLMNSRLRIYTSPDVVGTEIGGALKNVIALGCGMSDGLHFGDNARAALMTRGLVEIARLGVQMGAALATFSGLTGVGDLIVTCQSRHSRNWNAGFLIGSGSSVDEALLQVGMAVEGIRTARAAQALADAYGVEMPISVAIADILFAGKAPLEAVGDLMSRSRTHEVEELAVDLPVSWLYG